MKATNINQGPQSELVKRMANGQAQILFVKVGVFLFSSYEKN